MRDRVVGLGLLAIAVAVTVTTLACKGKPDAPAATSTTSAMRDAATSVDALAPALDAAVELDNHALALSVCPRVTVPYLFRVERRGRASYLLGTRHLGITLDRMPPIVAERVRAAHLAVFEIAPGDEPTPIDAPGGSLADALGTDAWAHYRALVGDAVAAAVEHEPPSIAIIMTIAAFEDPSGSLDQQLEDLAVAAHVPTRGLEKAAFQDHLFTRLLDLRALRATVATTASRDELRAETVDDLGSYCRGDRMDRTTHDEDEMKQAGYTDDEIAAYDDLLVFGRNRAWIPQLEPIFDGGDAFVAVGLDHLLGDRGLIAALTKDGYRVTRVAP